jgi:hypothetical protein
LFALVALLLLAWQVARHEPPPMTVSPARAAPGETVVISFENPGTPQDRFVVERDGREVLVLDPDPPPEIFVRSSMAGFPNAQLVNVIPAPHADNIKITLPYDLARGTYRLCTQPRPRTCATLTVGFGPG